MKKTLKTSIPAISIALLGLVWIFAVAAYTLVLALPWACWGSITCTVIAMIAAEIYLLVFQKDPGEESVEAGALGTIFTIGFFLITLLLNSVFVLLACGDFNWIVLTLNLISIVCYVILLVWVEQHTAKLTKQLIMTEQKTSPSREIARKLGELLAITEDTEIRGKLRKLKEAVDYGTNISTNATSALENQMNDQLDEIVQLTIGRADRLIILNKVSAAEMTWKMRSSTASSSR